MSAEKIDIRPGVGILSVLKSVDYRPWFALAEFVDNALQSFLARRDAITKVDGADAQVRVGIMIDQAGTIAIRDNAGGISKEEFPRAFRPAELPPDRSGLSEFGMGMKSAACWFAPRWEVRTSAVGDPYERVIRFDVDRIVEDKLEELEVEVKESEPDAHFTEILLRDPYKLPYGKTIGKIKEHLADIYRVFTRSGTMTLFYNGEQLSYEGPEVLIAPRWDDLDTAAVRWSKEIDFDFGRGLRAHGFAALRETGSTSRAGFALFRRNRLIQGSGDEGYRPHAVFGRPNSYRYQRLFGELHLEGFNVSHTKDGFKWDDSEEPFLSLLRDRLDEEPLPLLKQAEGWRPSRMEARSGAEEAAERIAEAISTRVPDALLGLEEPEDDAPPAALLEEEVTARREVRFEHKGEPWRVVVELSTDPGMGQWLEMADGLVDDQSGDGARTLGVRLSLSHPFMVKHCGPDAQQIEPLLRVAAALALAERMARLSDRKKIGLVRLYLNDLLRNGFAD